MRCPQCSERNSVAARKCAICGEKFARKPVPKGLLIGAGAVAVAIAGTVFLTAMLPAMIDVEAKLGRVAKRVATGPKSHEDAKAMKRDLDDVIKEFLVRNGDIKGGVLRDKLKQALARDAFEVHVIDLPRDLRIVEVDTLLQATSYLVMKGNSGTKVFKLNGLEVFDDARIINDQAGPVLVVLGHTGGQSPHRPQIRAYALLPDYIQEESEKVVPQINAEGYAKFVAGNSNDINIEVSLPSALLTQGFFAANPVKDYIPLRMRFVWKDAHYLAKTETPEGPISLLWNIAQVMRQPDNGENAKAVLAESGVTFAKSVASKAQFAFSRTSEGRNTRYTLVGDAKSIDFNFRKSRSGNWNFVNGSTQALSPEVANKHLQAAIAANHLTMAPPPMVAAVSNAQVAVPASNGSAVAAADMDSVQSQVAAPQQPEAPAKILVAKSAFSGTTSGAAPEAVTTKTPAQVVAVAPKPIAPDPSAAMAATLPPTAVPPASSTSRRAANNSSNSSGKSARATMNRNIRSSPTSRSRSVGTMTIGSSVQVLGKIDGWIKVRCNGGEGYVYGGVSSSGAPEIANNNDDNDSNTSSRRSESRESRRSRRAAKVAQASRKSSGGGHQKGGSFSWPQSQADEQEDTGPVVINLDSPKSKVKIAQKHKGKADTAPPEFVP